jgi:hypothetical protein
MVLVRRLLVVLAVAGAGLVPAPATAAMCSTAGISVVVDFGALGGGIRTGCDASGNRNAATAFENTDNHLSYASRQPGFVCRVRGIPASDPCINTAPADAYWGLYWSDGTSGWKYASTSAGSLTVPAGGSVAFSWQNGGGDPPGIAPASPAPPATRAPAPAPTKQPTKQTTTQPTKNPAAATPATPGATSSTTAPIGSGRASASTRASGSPSTANPSPTTSPSPDASAADQAEVSVDAPAADRTDDGGLAWWVPVGVLALLAAGGGSAWWTRRRRGSP